MDPNVQVLLGSILVAIITTSGVVLVALINNRSSKPDSRDNDAPDEHLDERDVLERMLSLISENERKEASIGRLRMEVLRLEEETRVLKSENAQLILKKRMEASDE